MNDFILDIAVETKRLDGVWVECEDADVAWYGCKFLIRPATTHLAERVALIQKRSQNGKHITKFTEALLRDLLFDTEGIGTDDSEATLEEVINYFSQIPAFVAWIMEQSVAIASHARDEVEEELGN